MGIDPLRYSSRHVTERFRDIRGRRRRVAFVSDHRPPLGCSPRTSISPVPPGRGAGLQPRGAESYWSRALAPSIRRTAFNCVSSSSSSTAIACRSRAMSASSTGSTELSTEDFHTSRKLPDRTAKESDSACCPKGLVGVCGRSSGTALRVGGSPGAVPVRQPGQGGAGCHALKIRRSVATEAHEIEPAGRSEFRPRVSTRCASPFPGSSFLIPTWPLLGLRRSHLGNTPSHFC